MKTKLYLEEYNLLLPNDDPSLHSYRINLQIDKISFFYIRETQIDFKIRFDKVVVKKKEIYRNLALIKPYLVFENGKDMLEFVLKWR